MSPTATEPASSCAHCREIQEERAAIHQFDGGATKEQADLLASSEHCPLHNKPDSHQSPQAREVLTS